MTNVFIGTARCNNGACTAFIPQIYVMLRVESDNTATCRTAGRLNAHTIRQRDCEQSIGVLIAQVILCYERQLMQILNAVDIVRRIPLDRKIVFAPDRNLGNYIKSVTGRDDMVVWDGACHVHEEFSVEKILELKKTYPGAPVLAHPECKKTVLLTADYIGSTAALLEYASSSLADTFIVVTESGILHRMQQENPNKRFIPAPPIDSTCGCNDCRYMKLVTLEKIYRALRDEQPEVVIEEELRREAERSIRNMLEGTF